MQTQIKNALRAGTNFASVAYTTQVATAAAHKHMTVEKHVVANVQLFGTLNDFNVYANAVKRNAVQHDNNVADVQQFEAQSNYFAHDDAECFSIVTHKQNGRKYLYCIYNFVQSVQYTIDNVAATKAQVAELLTASAKAKLLQDSNTTHNVANNVTHSVVVRTIALDNVHSVTANKQTVAA